MQGKDVFVGEKNVDVDVHVHVYMKGLVGRREGLEICTKKTAVVVSIYKEDFELSDG